MSVYAGAVIQGFPRVGANRELKAVLESYWAGKASREELEHVAAHLRKEHWSLQAKAGLHQVQCNDFSYYDTTLDTVLLFGAEPERFKEIPDSLDRYFAMARGTKTLKAMALRKWYTTNYHYLVPELSKNQTFTVHGEKILAEYREAKALGYQGRISLVGPLSFLALADLDPGEHPQVLDSLVEAYCQLISTVSFLDEHLTLQLDESVLARDLSPQTLACIRPVYNRLIQRAQNVDISITISHGHGGAALGEICRLPLAELCLDFVHGPKNIDALAGVQDCQVACLVLGLIDGRNVWACDYQGILDQAQKILALPSLGKLPLWRLGSSCSLLHLPYRLTEEKNIPGALRENLAFAEEKLGEFQALDRYLSSKVPKGDFIRERTALLVRRQEAPGTVLPELRATLQEASRLPPRSPWEERRKAFRGTLKLPVFPTTTIGSFPQTAELRAARKQHKQGLLTKSAYDACIADEIKRCIRFQEDCDLDVLVHGESERNDMVEYFGEQLGGYAFTNYGWVQSYGSRCVKPPIIHGDVYRPTPMTVDTWRYAQGLTKRPVKGMLTGPVTMLNWAFPRIDLPRDTIAGQIALALRDEIRDLVQAGAKIIQVDEAAFKEGRPLRAEEGKNYEDWAVRAFRLAIGSAPETVAIHTHMCYSDFSDMMDAIKGLDADVISIEAARSGASVLEAVKAATYHHEIGPGVYDIHSPRIPRHGEMKALLLDCLKLLEPDQVWVNPDCGLKTRSWAEVEPALEAMVAIAKELRAELPAAAR